MAAKEPNKTVSHQTLFNDTGGGEPVCLT